MDSQTDQRSEGKQSQKSKKSKWDFRSEWDLFYIFGTHSHGWAYLGQVWFSHFYLHAPSKFVFHNYATACVL